ncbi:4'-phosphopantetheinyl transferase superfamily protein [Cyanobacterium aponinum AL20118]|uniref:4'-phosphopantetheinyl transferase superfamily protein n=1 Tax=Cyanobacterium aponinum AL20115 TaxID=3090662 RepID=A0AAF1C6L4_9CHRO|nr:4'-phosphopantetheinyl transferase superfamily protein [Cyanobacterium aponinum]WPF89379.1 4'-phosphopantetheinyl transferase superfamily protein [Cyanobacterium aponinum AL20115]
MTFWDLQSWQKISILPLSLFPYDVHLFYGNVSNFLDFIPFFKSLLSDDELNKALYFKSQKRCNSYLVNKGILRVILANYLLIKPEDIFFSYNKKGKPVLDFSINNIGLNFNLSHSKTDIIYGFSLLNLGVDLEELEDNNNLLRIAKRFFAQEEYQYLQHLKKEEQVKTFYQFWTKKEAYLKAIGEGLSGGLNTINFCTNSYSQWQINNFSLDDNFVGAIAVNTQYKCNYCSLELLPEILEQLILNLSKL